MKEINSYKVAIVSIKCKIIKGRLVPFYPVWYYSNINRCVHGEPLKLKCTFCEEWIRNNP